KGSTLGRLPRGQRSLTVLHDRFNEQTRRSRHVRPTPTIHIISRRLACLTSRPLTMDVVAAAQVSSHMPRRTTFGVGLPRTTAPQAVLRFLLRLSGSDIARKTVPPAVWLYPGQGLAQEWLPGMGLPSAWPFQPQPLNCVRARAVEGQRSG